MNKTKSYSSKNLPGKSYKVKTSNDLLGSLTGVKKVARRKNSA